MTNSDEMSTFAGRLFGRTDPETPAEDDKPANYVPREGTNPKAGEPDDLRTFTRDLFDRAHRD